MFLYGHSNTGLRRVSARKALKQGRITPQQYLDILEQIRYEEMEIRKFEEDRKRKIKRSILKDYHTV
jgi:hypothetical protein